jgi:hypothetical protein
MEQNLNQKNQIHILTQHQVMIYFSIEYYTYYVLGYNAVQSNESQDGGTVITCTYKSCVQVVKKPNIQSKPRLQSPPQVKSFPIRINIVCSQSPFGVLKNGGAQINWASTCDLRQIIVKLWKFFLLPPTDGINGHLYRSLRFSVSHTSFCNKIVLHLIGVCRYARS